MITKIEISRFGLFKDFDWDTTIGTQETFRRLNIIYGRNYSGKTTMARVFKCLEDATLHKDYPSAEFSITLGDGRKITNLNLATCTERIRVYNTDFVKANLSWLHNEDGAIEPFTILGAENVELEGRIREINERLGTEDFPGLIQEYHLKQEAIAQSKKNWSSSKSVLENKLRSRANDNIKTDATLFVVSNQKRSYTISDINAEIEQIKNDVDSHIIEPIETGELIKSLKESVLVELEPLKEIKPVFAEFVRDTKLLIERKIRPTETISELISDSLLQEWVREGVNLHHQKRSTCGFCGNTLNEDIWQKLGAHFNKESEDLRGELETKIERLQNAKSKLVAFQTLRRENFYLSLQVEFDELQSQWDESVIRYSERIDELIRNLENRKSNIFQDLVLPDIVDESETIFQSIIKFNELVTKHNLKSGTLLSDQQDARKRLRFSHIAQFIKDIDYLNTLQALDSEEETIILTDTATIPLRDTIAELQENKRVLETDAKDESRGAELVNMHLSHFFGHQELKLVAEGESPQMKFVIKREGELAYNLSEGECSLISFCYFIARIQDELKDASNSNKLIIYIDDPISSLDCNHIFFMFSLIENIIAKPKKYGRLFISTHNLDFLKYLKQLTHATWKPQANSKDKPDLRYFMIERKERSISTLKESPAYLRQYITEFNYLFHQIYKCAEAEESTISSDHQYSFGNNLRKFLEAYTFYKYPSHKLSFSQRLDKFFAEDQISMVLISRMMNEYSHLENQFDRSTTPIDVAEIMTISKAVIERLKASDRAQFDALIESIS